jgi:hypothetical protein
MGLVVSVILLEGVVKVTIEPHKLGHNTEVKGHLGVLVGTVVVTGTDGVELLVEVGMDDGISQIVVGFLPEVLGEIRRVEVDCCHIIK